MRNEQEVAYLLFDMIVRQLEMMSEEERMVQRIEVVDHRLDLTMKNGSEYRIDVNPAFHPEEEEKEPENVMEKSHESQDVIQIPLEDWEELVKACKSAIHFLEYDERKLGELEALVPDFPWAKRSQMVTRLVEHLEGALLKIDPDLEEED